MELLLKLVGVTRLNSLFMQRSRDQFYCIVLKVHSKNKTLSLSGDLINANEEFAA